jgi:hypothetical protein
LAEPCGGEATADANPSLAQIHSALAYYYENKNELHAEIERQTQ